jgi:hypothetical protein
MAATDQPKVGLSKPLPALVRVGQHVVVRGRVAQAPAHTSAALQTRRQRQWTTVARASVGHHAAFRISWPVTGSAGPLLLRVAALRDGRVIAATHARQSAVGPRAVYCAPPVPPAVNIPVGCLYLDGGPFPGIFECEQQPYTIKAESSAGAVVASQQVAAGHSYTLVVPAGNYTLRASACGFGSATVTAGHQTRANTTCAVP